MPTFRAFLCVHGKPLINGERIREFIHRPQFEKNCYVWKNRELTPEEHEAVARKVGREHADLHPYTRLVVVPDVQPDPRDARLAEIEAALARAREEITQLRPSLATPKRGRA